MEELLKAFAQGLGAKEFFLTILIIFNRTASYQITDKDPDKMPINTPPKTSIKK